MDKYVIPFLGDIESDAHITREQAIVYIGI